MNTEIYTEEWLAELDAAMNSAGDDGVTITEISDATGHCSSWISKRLRKLIADGRIAVGRARRQAIDGIMRPVPVYRWVTKHAEPGRKK